MIEIEKTPLEGVLLIKPQVFEDERGYFIETWQKDRYSHLGIDSIFLQDNHSVSRRGILRGLHYQINHPQGKLVSVSYGEVYDVVVDLRFNSPSYGKWFGAFISQTNHFQLWVPPGFAHGFLVMSEVAHFHYKCTDYYYPNDEGIIRWNDDTLGIQWPITSKPILSKKDAEAPSFSNFSPVQYQCFQ